MSYLYLDFETRSTVDLKKVGVYAYAHHPDTEITCTGWALDGEEARVASGFPFGVCQWFYDFLKAGGTIVAHNAQMEREMLAAQGFRLPWERFVDTAALGARMALPRKLETLAAALKLDQQKDMAGHRIMLRFARPKNGWDADDGEFWEEDDKPEDFAALLEYCRQDVVVMREIHRRLLPLSETEKKLYCLTGRMNDRGVKADLSSIPDALAILDRENAAGEAEFRALTGGYGVKSYKKVAQALGLPDVRKPTVRNALRRTDLPATTMRALELFKRLARSSPAKLRALQNRASADGRIRGALIYSGAERTQRWSSGGVQLHNLPRGLGEETETAFDALAAGVLDMVYEDSVGTIAEMLRGFFVGPLLVGDFAQIEARTLNWLAGQKDVVQLFAEGKDVYSYTASKIFGKPIDKKSTDDRLPPGVTPRFVGKTVELGAGYGIGPEKFKRQLDEVFDVQIDLDFAMRSIATYRSSHQHVVAFWRRLEQAFQYAVQRNAPRVQVDGRLAMGNVVVGGLRYAYIELPSARRLYYAEPEMTADGVRYWGRNIYAGGKWDRVSTYGGKLAENVTQALSRDLLAHSMLNLEAAGYQLILQVHDEVVVDARTDDLLDNFKAIMLCMPSWAAGLPVDVEAFATHRYRK